MWTGRYWSARYWADAFWAKVGAILTPGRQITLLASTRAHTLLASKDTP